MQYPRHLILDYQITYSESVRAHWATKYYWKVNTTESSQTVIGSGRTSSTTRPVSTTTNTLEGTQTLGSTNVHFVRKEVIYTKLKYSRCPQYDIVSGGMAALFSAFLGFLISEKFGLELVDSGDFYIAFMYGVFVVFSCRPLIKIVNTFEADYRFMSPRLLYVFYWELATKFAQAWASLLTFSAQFNFPKTKYVLEELYKQEQITVWYRTLRYWIRFLKNYPLKVEY